MSHERKFNFAEKLCVLCCVLYNVLEVQVPGILTIELPSLLRRCDNRTDVGSVNGTVLYCVEHSWEQPGVVLGAMYSPALLLAFFLGHIASIVHSKLLYAITLLCHATASLVLASGASFAFLTVGAFLEGLSFTLGSICVPDILRTTFDTDKARCRVMNLCGLGRVIGYACGYFLSTLVYETFGHGVMFAWLGGTWVIMSITMFALRFTDHNDGEKAPLVGSKEEVAIENSEESASHDATQEKEEHRQRSYVKILKSCYMIAVMYQGFFIYSSTAAVVATAPMHLQLSVGFSAIENGIITALALLITFLVMVFFLLFVKSNFSRVCAMLFLISGQIIGTFVYPSVESFALGVFCDAVIHSSRISFTSLHSSLIMLISDHENVSFVKANAVFITVRYSAGSVGSFVSGYMYQLLPFDVMYYVIAVALVPVLLTSLIYCRLVQAS